MKCTLKAELIRFAVGLVVGYENKVWVGLSNCKNRISFYKREKSTEGVGNYFWRGDIGSASNM